MKNIKKYIISLIVLIVYLIVSHLFEIYIPCPIHYITGFYCPGCGITRLIYSMLKLDFYQAFRYNPLLFIMLPFFIFFIINDIYSKIKNKEPLYRKVPNYVYIFIIVLLIIYGILRNIFPSLAPTNI